jgi:1,4-alpha-glucan branching enzyme
MPDERKKGGRGKPAPEPPRPHGDPLKETVKRTPKEAAKQPKETAGNTPQEGGGKPLKEAAKPAKNSGHKSAQKSAGRKAGTRGAAARPTRPAAARRTAARPARSAPQPEVVNAALEAVEKRVEDVAHHEPLVARTAPPIDTLDRQRLLDGTHTQPHSVLGAHPYSGHGVDGVVVRVRQPGASEAAILLPGMDPIPLEAEGDDFFAALLPGARLPLRYRVGFSFASGERWERGDPYRFPPTIGEVDLHLFNEGTHLRLWEKLGSHVLTIDGVAGTSFAVWAPNAQRVSVTGEFCGWDGRIYPMRSLGSSGVFEIFIPGITAGTLYKYEILTREGALRIKSDPYAFKHEQPPGSASIVQEEAGYSWRDDEWMRARPMRDITREPVSIYEVHLGSWLRVPEEEGRSLSYREIAPRLRDHVRNLGFTHVELLPVQEHPFYGSWGYQVSGYYAPTSRYGSPDDFRFLVDTLHQAGIGVILDWVPAHFPKDDFALRRFDGTALYEHEDPRLGEHPDWGTLIFNYGRNEVRNFLIANALYWLQEFHIDALRVDAVASMLYLDYSRQPGQWMRNRYGGRENLDAIDFLRQLNAAISQAAPGCAMIAEESTAWPGVTKAVPDGGLGFTLKWNMGWMHDTLQYFEKDPIYRRHHQDSLTFAMVYEYSEKFVMPLSHDEVVHLKGSVYSKMPGDHWQKLANLRTLLAYQFTRPGKKLLFMGTELATPNEWNHDASLDWHLAEADPMRAGFMAYVGELARLYRAVSPFWRNDHSWEGFSWTDVSDRENSVISYVRWDGMEHAMVVLNLTPLPRENYRVGAPTPGKYRCLLSSDETRWGGSGAPSTGTLDTEASPFHGYPQSMVLTLPPLAAIVVARVEHAGQWGLDGEVEQDKSQ